MKTLRLLSALSLIASAACLSAAPALAQSAAPVPAPTIITSAPYTITTAGYYQLGANLNYDGNGSTNDAIITVNASNVTLDFGGHYIAGPTNNTATQLYGVYANERANLVIQNGTVSSCSIGVFLYGNGSTTTNNRNARLLNMTLTKCYYVGAEIRGGISPEFDSCHVSSIGGSTSNNNFAVGLYFYDCTASKAVNNSVSEVAITGGTNGYGIVLPTYAVGNFITGCSYGLEAATKYKDNLTSSCATSFYDCTTDVGNNN